jgi:predicted NUDIX family NTP pyrophosphohydrolase
MALLDKANLIIYRIREKGLEVFLVNSPEGNDKEEWTLPQGKISDPTKAIALLQKEQTFELDPVENVEGEAENAIAVEGDWHDIPSLKSLIKDDASFMKDTIKQMIPDLEQRGTYFAVKEAFKKVLPSQYEFLKELKDIIRDRNSTKYM